MTRRAVVLSLLFVVGSQLSSGCCCWRPFLWRGHCWPHCYGPGGASAPAMAAGPVVADPGCACYSPPIPAPALPAGTVMPPQGQPVFIGPAVPYGQPQVSPGGNVPNPMAPAGTPKN